MDYYRLRCPPCSGCKSIEYTPRLLDCAYPPLEDSSGTLFEEAKKREEFLFFSQKELRTRFKDEGVIKDILDCSCDGCVERGPGPTQMERARRSILDPKSEEWLLLVMLIYLGKLHRFHDWVACKPDNIWSFPRLLPDIPKHDLKGATERRLFQATERRLFRAAYHLTEHMFRPQKLMMSDDWLQPFHKLQDPDIRFPYVDDPTYTFTRGSFGQMTKFSIPPEYVDKSVRSRLVGYPSSNDGVQEKYHFVRKVLNGSISNDINIQMEIDLLHMLASIKEEVSNNIITLLFSYRWRSRIYFIFPFVAGDLHRVLNAGWRPRGIPVETSNRLPEYWLWKEMIDVCKALEAIHTGIENPFPDPGRTKVVAFHFDLKPANILVTQDGTLKITDFGQSLIQLVEDKDEISAPYRGGDFAYCAPEGRPSRDSIGSVYASASGATSDEVKVLLNYDTWAVACIMTEVLTYFFGGSGTSGSDAVQRLREERLTEGMRENPENYTAFFTSRITAGGKQHTLRKCISDKLNAFLNESPDDFASQQYVKETVALILTMFETNNMRRPFSDKVVEDLNAAQSTYSIARNHPRDDLYQYVQHVLVDKESTGEGWNRIGWREPGLDTVHAFVEMGEVSFEVYFSTAMPKSPHKIETHPHFPRSPCRFHIYHKKERKSPKESPAEFYLQLGFKQSKVLGLRHFEQVIKVSKWFLAPIYMDDDSIDPDGDRVYKVALVKPMDQTSAQSQVIILVFKSLANAQELQSALLRYRVSSIHSADRVTTTKPRRKVVQMKDDVAIQIWSEVQPQYTAQGRRGSAHPARISTGMRSMSIAPQPKCCMVLFDSTMPFLVVPICTKNKRLDPDTADDSQAKFSPETRAGNHKSFPVLNQKPGVPQWDTKWAVRTIPLDQYQFETSNGRAMSWEEECRSMEIKFRDTRSRKQFMENIWHFGAFY